MSVFSKMHGYPMGYFNSIYKYLLNDGQIKSEKDLIELVKNFGYPPEIINRLAQETICSDGINIPNVEEQWDIQLQLDKEADEDIEMGYNNNDFNYDLNIEEYNESETDGLSSSD